MEDENCCEDLGFQVLNTLFTTSMLLLLCYFTSHGPIEHLSCTYALCPRKNFIFFEGVVCTSV